ncbi:hypothetical protein HDE_08409 [Halotydeus destructor]|nr:hypothetical protein HDE_08409 [Halotydeus destructor]
MLDMKHMPTTYKVCRLLLAISSAFGLYTVFVMVAFLVCVMPHVFSYDPQAAGQMTSSLVGSILVFGGLDLLGYYGAVYHHYRCLVVLAAIHAIYATLVLLVSLFFLPGVGIFLYLVINTCTLVPAYMAYCIKNVHLFTEERIDLSQC